MGNGNSKLRKRVSDLEDNQRKMSENREEAKEIAKDVAKEVVKEVAAEFAKVIVSELRKDQTMASLQEQSNQTESGKKENEPGLDAHKQEHHVKRGKCFIYDLKLKDNRHEIDDGLTSKVEQLYEKFEFVIKTSRNLPIIIPTKECDFVALYVFHLGEKRQLDAVLKTIYERNRPSVPWLAVIQVKPELDVNIDDTRLRNTLLVTTDDEEIVFMFNEKLRLQSEILDLSTIESDVMNTVLKQGKNYKNLCSLNSLNRKVFLH